MKAALAVIIIVSASWMMFSQQGNTLKETAPAATTIAQIDQSRDRSPIFADRQETDTSDYRWYPVVKVVDGDTIVVEIDGKNTTIRLIGLDTPETVDPRKTVQCFGEEASTKARQILSGSSVRLEMDASQGELDKYGRLLAYVFLPDGTNVSEFMIAEGYGHEYTYNLPYKYMEAFKAAEKKAQEQKKGLWADNACISTGGAARPGLAAPSAESPAGNECARNTYNCSDFKAQAEAQSAFESCGGTRNDVHKLDSDLDGRVCESLP